jgi:inositol phosphorylceramide mannosyltransferase catalytic subunit
MNRRIVVVLLLVVFAPLFYFLYIASSLIALLFEDGLQDSVSLAAIEAHGNSSIHSHPIPKIIHQTWKNENIPEQWQIAQFTWYGSPSWFGARLKSCAV